MKIETNWGTYRHKEESCSPIVTEETLYQRDNPGHGDCTYTEITVSKHSIMDAYHLSNIK